MPLPTPLAAGAWGSELVFDVTAVAGDIAVVAAVTAFELGYELVPENKPSPYAASEGDSWGLDPWETPCHLPNPSLHLGRERTPWGYHTQSLADLDALLLEVTTSLV